MDPKQTTVADLIKKYPSATGILERHRIDYCCGGGRTLAEACGSAGVSPEALLADVAKAQARPSQAMSPAAKKFPLGGIVTHVIEQHDRLKERLPKLRAMTIKVATVHGPHRPEFGELAEIFHVFADELERHLDREKRIVFPAVQSGRSSRNLTLVRVMRGEHERYRKLLDQMRALCDGYAAPDHACNTWRGLYAELESLDRAVREHIALENKAVLSDFDTSEAAAG